MPGWQDNYSNCLNCGMFQCIDNGTQLPVYPKQPERLNHDQRFKFSKAMDMNRDYRDFIGREFASNLQPVVDAFIQNMDRVSAVVSFPIFLVGRAVTLQSATEQAIFQARNQNPGGQLNDAEIKRRTEEILSNEARCFVLDIKHRWIGEGASDSIINSTPSVERGVLALLSSQIIGAWTAFEVLAQDLCNASLANYPHLFTHIGTGKQFSFQKLETIRNAYQDIFPNASEINSPINDICIDALATARNLLVHQAGRIDKKFKKDCKNRYLTEWEALPEGSNFECTGDMIVSLFDRVVTCECRLINAVANHLSSTP